MSVKPEPKKPEPKKSDESTETPVPVPPKPKLLEELPEELPEELDEETKKINIGNYNKTTKEYLEFIEQYFNADQKISNVDYVPKKSSSGDLSTVANDTVLGEMQSGGKTLATVKKNSLEFSQLSNEELAATKQDRIQITAKFIEMLYKTRDYSDQQKLAIKAFNVPPEELIVVMQELEKKNIFVNIKSEGPLAKGLASFDEKLTKYNEHPFTPPTPIVPTAPSAISSGSKKSSPKL